MEWASGSVETAYGCVSSEWKHEGDLLRWRITIPASTNALVALPLGKTVTVNGKPMEQSPKSTRGDKAFYEFASGQYEIEL
jgi:alpha-L-rhamnosidase